MPNLDDIPREVANTMKAGAAAAPRKMHPMLIVAAGAVTLFSAVGIAVMTGIIPSAHSVGGNSAPSPQASGMPATTAGAGAAMAAAGSAEAPRASTAAGGTLKPIDSAAGVGQPLERAEQQSTARAQASTTVNTPAPAPRVAAAPQAAPYRAPAPTAAPRPTVIAQAAPATTALPGSMSERAPSAPRMEEVPNPVVAQNNVIVRPAAPPVCRTCGTVDSVMPIEQAGQGSGAGAVLGGVLGGILGHQVGKGKGRDVATVAGAVGGAVLGNQVEKGTKTSRSFDTRVRMEDGTYQTIRTATEPSVRVGDKVRVENGQIVR